MVVSRNGKRKINEWALQAIIKDFDSQLREENEIKLKKVKEKEFKQQLDL